MRKQFLRVTSQEIDGVHRGQRADDSTDKEVVMTTLDDHFTQPNFVPSA